ncbi:MAG: FAD-binding protein, partial [Pseudonocardia sp.]|nr:FAD-binding protein [Pseudonocardia sp.]
MPDQIVDVAIVGSGFAGLGAAVKLAEAGRGDFVIVAIQPPQPGAARRSRPE